MAANNVNGTTAALSPTDLNNQFTMNGWTLSPTYGASNAVVAQNIVTLFLAYTTSVQYYNDQLFLMQQAQTIYADRPNFSPAQFGIEGLSSSTTAAIGVPLWGLVSGNLSSQLLSNYTAEQFYNLNFAYA